MPGAVSGAGPVRAPRRTRETRYRSVRRRRGHVPGRRRTPLRRGPAGHDRSPSRGPTGGEDCRPGGRGYPREPAWRVGCRQQLWAADGSTFPSHGGSRQGALAPLRRDATTTCNALITSVTAIPTALVKTLTWDQGSEMAAHAAFSLATTVDVYFAHPHSPWERGTNENRSVQRTPARILPQRHPHHRRPDLPRRRSPRTQQPATPYPRLPNPSRSLHRRPGQLNCYHRLTPLRCPGRPGVGRVD